MNPLQHHLVNDFPPEERRSWYSRWSGNRLDIHVRSNFARSPEAFREGVIDVGYLLQSLDHSLRVENLVLEIQSFPSLDQAQWVASVRFHRGGRRSPASSDLSERTEDPVEALAELALDWSFSFLFLDREHDTSPAGEHAPKTPSVSFRGILETSGNNPFVWLQVGRWLKDAEVLMDRMVPNTQLSRQTSIPEKISRKIPLRTEIEPWNDLIPLDRATSGKNWTPQLLLQLRPKAE